MKKIFFYLDLFSFYLSSHFLRKVDCCCFCCYYFPIIIHSMQVNLLFETLEKKIVRMMFFFFFGGADVIMMTRLINTHVRWIMKLKKKKSPHCTLTRQQNFQWSDAMTFSLSFFGCCANNRCHSLCFARSERKNRQGAF